jgi:hypothetical protein
VGVLVAGCIDEDDEKVWIEKEDDRVEFDMRAKYIVKDELYMV